MFLILLSALCFPGNGNLYFCVLELVTEPLKSKESKFGMQLIFFEKSASWGEK